MKPRVLVVDNNADMRLSIEVRLHRVGFDVLTAADGAQALALADIHRPAAVLVDLLIPGLDRAGFLAAMRARPETPLIYAMTDGEEAPRDLAGPAGVAGTVSKTEALSRDFPGFLQGRLDAFRRRPSNDPRETPQAALAA